MKSFSSVCISVKRIEKKGIYQALFLGSFLGWSWLIFNQFIFQNYPISQLHACFIKQITGLPCPSCGSTRSAMSLLSGHVQEAFIYNPLGIVLVILLLTIPAWLIFDLIRETDSLYRFYKTFLNFFKSKIIIGSAIILIISNWIWNFMKGY